MYKCHIHTLYHYISLEQKSAPKFHPAAVAHHIWPQRHAPCRLQKLQASRPRSASVATVATRGENLGEQLEGRFTLQLRVKNCHENS